jgi:23S rRNA (guanosine2251-2'-O)-methyltransferase
MEMLYGLHPVEEAIRSGSRKLDHVHMAKERSDKRLDLLLAACKAAGIRVSLTKRDELTRIARTDSHQGVVAFARERQFYGIEDFIKMNPQATAFKDGYRFFLALDGVEDPHNLGALLRTADAAGVDGVVLPERRSAPVTATVAKTSAGASEHIKIAKVTNIVRSLEQMKQNNIWCIGLDEKGLQDYDAFDFKMDCVLVLGREGEGLHALTKKTCDYMLRIPMLGSVPSLNVSVAGAVVMYEMMRQRRGGVTLGGGVEPKKKKQKGLGS